MPWTIYCIENKANGKKYIGQTIYALRLRWCQHIYNALRKQAKTRLYSAIRKYGANNFEVRHIMTCYTQEDANLQETNFIRDMRLLEHDFGYNMCEGGAGVKIKRGPMTLAQRQKISAAHRGKKLSDDHRRLISQIQIGNKKRLGKMHSDETKQKIRETLTGRKLTEEQRAFISERMKGHVVSSETRAKISAANRGKVRTEEMRRRNSESRKGKKPSPATIEKVRAALTGRPRPEEVRRKISEGNRGKEGSKGEDNGSSKLTEDQVREIKRLFANGARNIDVMKQFGMSKGAIANIKSGRSWSHVILNERDVICKTP